MNENNDQKNFADFLRQSIRPVNADLNRDLWPQMLRRLDQRPIGRNWLAAMLSAATLRAVPWFDWALLAALIVGVAIFPRSIPIWLYHF